MNKQSEFWKLHTDASGNIQWPQSTEERDSLARSLFGICLMEALDYWLAHADSCLDESAEPTSVRRHGEDPAYRTIFAAMTTEQRNTIRKFVRETAHGVLWSSLVHIDQIPAGVVEISLGDDSNRRRIHPSADDLQDVLYDWVWQFSEFRDQLMKREAVGLGTSVRWIVSDQPLPAK
jgi:hypothetical protein